MLFLLFILSLLALCDGKVLATKPLCTEVKKIPGMHNGAFITRDPSIWRYRQDGSREYTLETCRLKRFTAHEARQCLAGHHMLLIGDSVSRYQYLSLVYFLQHGKWPPRFGIRDNCPNIGKHNNPTCSDREHPNIVMEGDWGKVYGHASDKSWKRMHMHIGGQGMGGRVECQCVRQERDSSMENMFYVSDHINVTHNLHTKMPSRQSSHPSQVRVTFLNNLIGIPMRGWVPTGCSEVGSCEMTEQQWFDQRSTVNANKYDYSYDLEEEGFFTALDEKHIAEGVDIALFNRGLWGSVPTDLKQAKQVFQGLFNLTSKHSGRCYWKGTTAPHSNAVPEEKRTPAIFSDLERMVRLTAYESGCGVYDLAHVTKEFTRFQWMGDIGRNRCCAESEMANVYFDAVHFQPWVSEEFNQILLNVLC